MTPDKRLDQIEPVLADVAQKTDRLIESNGQILEVAMRADANAGIAARGIADLTIKVGQLAEGQADLRNITIDLRAKTDSLAEGQADLRNITIDLRAKTDSLAEGQAGLRAKTDLLTEGQADLRNISVDLRAKTDLLAEGQTSLHRKIDLIADDQVKLRQDMNQKFAQVEKTQQQILTLLLDRLS